MESESQQGNWKAVLLYIDTKLNYCLLYSYSDAHVSLFYWMEISKICEKHFFTREKEILFNYSISN